MEIHYISNDIRKANSNDLKMIDKDNKKVLKINTLIWIKRIDNQIIDFFGPIVLDSNTSTEVFEQVAELLQEGRIYIINGAFKNIPQNIIQPHYQTVAHAND